MEVYALHDRPRQQEHQVNDVQLDNSSTSSTTSALERDGLGHAVCTFRRCLCM